MTATRSRTWNGGSRHGHHRPRPRTLQQTTHRHCVAPCRTQTLLKWVKGAYDGVQIESQRTAETTWTLIGMDTSSPYLDFRPPLVAGQPEIRRYHLRYFLNDAPTGDYSDIITITTTP